MCKCNYFLCLLASLCISFLLFSMMIMMANAARLEALDEMTLANPNQTGRKKAAHDIVQKMSSYSDDSHSKRPKSGGYSQDYSSGYYSGTKSYYGTGNYYSMQGNTSGGPSSKYSSGGGRRHSSSRREPSGNSKRRTSGTRNSNSNPKSNSMAIVPWRRAKSGGGESSRRSGYSDGKNQLIDAFGAMTLASQEIGGSFGALTQRQDDANQIEKEIQQQAQDIQKQYLPSVNAFRDQFYPHMKLVGEPGGPPIMGNEPPLHLDEPLPFVVEGACNGPACRPSSSQLLLPPPQGKTRTYNNHKSGKLSDGSDYTSGYVRTRSIGGKNSRDGYYSSDYSYYTETSPGGASKYSEGRRKSDSRRAHKSSERKKSSVTSDSKYERPRSSSRKSGHHPRSSSRGRGTEGESQYRRKKSSRKEHDSPQKSLTGEHSRRGSSTRERDSERTGRYSKGSSSYYQTNSNRTSRKSNGVGQGKNPVAAMKKVENHMDVENEAIWLISVAISWSVSM